MNKSFKQRLEALEQLEAEQEAESGRRLEVFLYIRPLDYFTLFEAEPFDAARCAEIDAEYGLDLIDWQHDRVQVSGGTWPGVLTSHASTIARIELPDGYGCRIDAARWVEREPGAPYWMISLDGGALPAVRRAHRETIRAGLDLVLSALGDGRAEIRPVVFGCAPGGIYGPQAYGLCMISDVEVQRWATVASSLMHDAGVRLSTVDDFRQWVWTYTLVENTSHESLQETA